MTGEAMTISETGRQSKRAMGVGVLGTLLLLLPGGIRAQTEAGGSAGGPGREPVTISIREAVMTALDQSRDIQDARLALKEAEERVSEAWGSVYPRIDFSASYTRNIAPAVSFLPAEFFGGEPGEFIKVQFGADNAWSSALVLDQPLFEAGVFIGVGAASRYQALQEETLRGRAQGLVTRVRVAYYTLLLAQEEQRLIQNSVARVRESLTETEALNRAGVASEYDVLRLHVELANLVPNLKRAENAVAQARRGLAIELNLQELETLEVAGSLASMDLEAVEANDAANMEILALSGLRNPLGVAPEEILDAAYDSRSDLKQLELTEKLRTAELRVQQGEYLPKISLFGNYSINAQQNGRPNFFGDPMTRATSKWVGISISVPVFTGLQRDARIDQARAVLNQARNQSLLARMQAESQVKSLLEQAQEALERARGQKLAVTQAQRGFEIASAQYQEGLSSQLELTDAEVALRQSEFNYARAVYDFLVFRAQLDESTGNVPMVNEAFRGSNVTQ
jgi:outer membrane protein